MKNNAEKKEARVSLLTIRLKWFLAAFIVFALEVGTYAAFLIPYELAKGKPAMETTQNIVAHMGDFLMVAFGSVVLIFGGIDIMMILRDYFRAEREKRIQREADAARAKGLAEGKAQGIAQGRTEGRTEGIAQGRTEGIAQGRTEGRTEGTVDMYQQWAAWNARRLNAVANGQTFTEPPPPPPQ